MPKVSKQTAARGGLMTAILGMIGNVVGIGIFFKNGTVFRLNGQSDISSANCWGVLVAWLISTLIVLFMAISFAEIASCKTKSGKAGIGPWASEFCGHRFGRYAKLGYGLIFWPVNTFAVMFFAGEALLNCFAPLTKGGWESVSSFDYGRGTTAYIFIVGAVLFALFMIVNYFKFKNMAKVGKAISFIKFAPIAMVVLIGIIFGALNGGGIWVQNSANSVNAEAIKAANTATASFNFVGVISCIPAILFSFEGYVAIDSFKNDLSNPDKQIPLGVVVGVAVIAALYFAVTIGCITAGTGDVYKLMSKLFGPNGKFANDGAYKALTMLISIFIFTCLIGCVNGMTRGGITSYQELCKEGSLLKGQALVRVKPGNDYFAGVIWFSIIMGIWFVILFIPSVIWNTDAIADGSSTSMIVMLYIIYGAIVACAFFNRTTRRVQISKDKEFNSIIFDGNITNANPYIKTKVAAGGYYIRTINRVEVKKNCFFPVAAIIGIIGCLFLVGYVAIYQYTVAPIMGGLANANNSIDAKAGWGMFVDVDWKNMVGFAPYPVLDPEYPGKTVTAYGLTNGSIMGWFWAMTIFAAGCPLINDALIRVADKSNKVALMWDKAPTATINTKVI